MDTPRAAMGLVLLNWSHRSDQSLAFIDNGVTS